jgi:hypothetical protein
MGLDCDDDQTRITRGKNFFLYGGSAETHGTMQETVVRINETLDRRGKRLEEVSLTELRDICQEVRHAIQRRGA